MTNLLVEGGGKILGAFFDDGQVDTVEAYLAPILEGGDHHFTPVRARGQDMMSHALRLKGGTVRRIGGDLQIRADLPGTWRVRIRDALGLPPEPVDEDVGFTLASDP
jgi:diaminohydroxyphosphoribosylaminopyrimidine deaminase/5-amino-6-(5-phosphoribosylamino)uracil reductase